MRKDMPSISEILGRAADMLVTARMALRQLKDKTVPRLLALRNVVVFGRSVTFVLKNLRNREQGVDQWYSRYVDQMRADELMKFFNNLRSRILKTGDPGAKWVVRIRQLNPADPSVFGPPPPNAKGFFIGDRLGGSGWEVVLPDGTVQKYYVKLPPNIGSVDLEFPDPPTSHLRQLIQDTSVEKLCELYLDYLSRMVKEARERFGPKDAD